jgi:hypothetical protein
MGSQQLLLTVVGIIVVGLMVYTGYNIGRDYMENANRDQVISTLYDLGLLAQQHYKKDITQGGGGGTYTGWAIPNNFKTTHSGSFEEVVREDRVDLSAIGTVIGRNGTAPVRVSARVDDSGIRVTVIN